MPLLDQTLRELLTAFSSSDPTPGGGSASALASAVGASLLMMVAGMPKTRTGSDAERAALGGAITRLTGLRQQLSEAIDADTAAYDQVVAAYRLPKASPEERQARSSAIQRALRTATDVPLGVMRVSATTLDEAAAVAAHGSRAASSDVGVAAGLLRAGGVGAGLNVEINLPAVKDATYADAVRAETRALSERIDRAAAAVDAALRASEAAPPAKP